MNDKPNLKDAAAILALPRFGSNYVELVADENGIAHYNGRAITCSAPGAKIKVPTWPQMRARWIDAGDLYFVRDADGVYWSPCLTDQGWMRQRVG